MERALRLTSLHRLRRLLALLLATLAVPLASAAPQRFALVAKSLDSPFFVQAGRGCASAAKARGDTCELLGPHGSPHFRRQNEVLKHALDDNRLAGIAVSVSNSQWLSDHALRQQSRIPLITFDSDLAATDRARRRAYIGLDNFALGRDLGRLAQRLRPKGGTLCILSGWREESNLHERIDGIRQQLGGTVGQLHGENGWSEPERCPLHNAGTFRTSLTQLKTLLQADEIDVIISVGDWLVRYPQDFRQLLEPRLAELKKQGKRPDIIVIVDQPSADLQAMLDAGLFQAYISNPAFEMGRQTYRLMKRLAAGRPVPEKTHLDYRVHLPRAPSHP